MWSNCGTETIKELLFSFFFFGVSFCLFILFVPYFVAAAIAATVVMVVVAVVEAETKIRRYK